MQNVRKSYDEQQLHTNKSRHRFNWVSVHGLISCHYTQCVQACIDHSNSSSLFLCFYFHFYVSFISFCLFSAYTPLRVSTQHSHNHCLLTSLCPCLYLCNTGHRYASLTPFEKKKNIFKHKIHSPTRTQVRHRRLLSR